MTTYPLSSSPITRLRLCYGLTQAAAAEKLGVAIPYMRVLEMRSREVPVKTLEAMKACFAPASRFTQLTIWDALAELERIEQGEGMQNA